MDVIKTNKQTDKQTNNRNLEIKVNIKPEHVQSGLVQLHLM